LEGPIVIASDVMGLSCLHLLPGCSEECVSGGCEYQQQKLKKPLMQDRTRFESRPPDHTGRLACNYWSSVRDVLQILVTADKSSNLARIEWPQQGEVRKTYWSLGPPRQDLRRIRASLAEISCNLSTATARSPYIADNESFKA